MKAKVKLFEYLESHLDFGCIQNVEYQIFDGHLKVTLYPFSWFSPAERDFIRENVLESEDVRMSLFYRLKYLSLQGKFIYAVYKFS